MPSVTIEGLDKKFGSFQAVSNVSFSIPEGGFCTLLGPSGCGKSTTLRLIAGLERPDSGRVLIGDQVMSSREVFVPAEQRRLGYVFQSYALWPHMKVMEQVAYPLRVQGFARREIGRMVVDALDVVGLSKEIDRYPSELSGGQQQRVALARALVFRPSVLLLDEPLSNLDAELRAQLRAELHELRSRINVTTIHVTHDQQEALSLSDIVVVMERGKVVESGTPEEIYARPKALHTATFVGAGNTLEGTVLKVEADGIVEVQVEDGTRLRGRTSATLAKDDRAIVLFRPEDVTIRLEGRGENHLRGTVADRMYYGAYSMLTIRVGGAEVRAQSSKSEHTKPGDVVGLDLADVLVFPANAAQQRPATASARERAGQPAGKGAEAMGAGSATQAMEPAT
jgi:iron(III) transport system ATP-binding protein